MIKTYYYAIDKDGQGWYYDNPPIFDGESWNVDPTYDCLECMGAVNDLHPANLFSFPIPEDMTYEDRIRYGAFLSKSWDKKTAGSGWQGMNNDYEWTSATDDVFKDCVIPATTFDKGPLQFEIDEQLNTIWYKE